MDRCRIRAVIAQPALARTECGCGPNVSPKSGTFRLCSSFLIIQGGSEWQTECHTLRFPFPRCNSADSTCAIFFVLYFRITLFWHQILSTLIIVPILIVFALNAIRRFLPWPALLAAISLSAFYPTTMMNFEGAYPGGCTDGAVAFILTSALFVG